MFFFAFFLFLSSTINIYTSETVSDQVNNATLCPAHEILLQNYADLIFSKESFKASLKDNLAKEMKIFISDNPNLDPKIIAGINEQFEEALELTEWDYINTLKENYFQILKQKLIKFGNIEQKICLDNLESILNGPKDNLIKMQQKHQLDYIQKFLKGIFESIKKELLTKAPDSDLVDFDLVEEETPENN